MFVDPGDVSCHVKNEIPLLFLSLSRIWDWIGMRAFITEPQDQEGGGKIDVAVAGQHLTAIGIDAKTLLLALLILAVGAGQLFTWYVDKQDQTNYQQASLLAHKLTQQKIDTMLSAEQRTLDAANESTRVHNEAMSDLICIMAFHDLRAGVKPMEIPRSLKKKLTERCE